MTEYGLSGEGFNVGISSDAHTTYPITCSASTSGGKDITMIHDKYFQITVTANEVNQSNTRLLRRNDYL